MVNIPDGFDYMYPLNEYRKEAGTAADDQYIYTRKVPHDEIWLVKRVILRHDAAGNQTCYAGTYDEINHIEIWGGVTVSDDAPLDKSTWLWLTPGQAMYAEIDSLAKNLLVHFWVQGYKFAKRKR